MAWHYKIYAWDGLSMDPCILSKAFGQVVGLNKYVLPNISHALWIFKEDLEEILGIGI
jgi:hypothetical protein